MNKVIAYPGDRPPILCDPPCSYIGALWRYVDATPANAATALADHHRNWPDWGVDDALAALAGHLGPAPRMTGDTYLAAWATNTASRDRGTSWCWSPPYATPGEASAKLKEMADEGTLIIGFVVVRDRSGKQAVLRNRTVPTAARKAIERWIELLDLI